MNESLKSVRDTRNMRTTTDKVKDKNKCLFCTKDNFEIDKES